MSTVVTLRPPAAVFREEQWFAWWIYALLCGMGALSWIGLSLARNVVNLQAIAAHSGSVKLSLLAAGFGLPMVLVFGVLRMTTEVTATQLDVWFGWLPTYRYSLSLADVRAVEVIRYRPLADHGFWGVRKGRDGERVLSARGDRGVRLHLADGTKLLIGSQRPEELAATIEKAIPSGL